MRLAEAYKVKPSKHRTFPYNIPEWSHKVIFLGTKQERYRNVPCRLFLGSIFIT